MAQPARSRCPPLLVQITSCAEEQEKEIAFLRSAVERLRTERDELLAQIRFAADHANRETRNAGSLRAQLLARSSVAPEKLDFCCGADARRRRCCRRRASDRAAASAPMTPSAWFAASTSRRTTVVKGICRHCALRRP